MAKNYGSMALVEPSWANELNRCPWSNSNLRCRARRPRALQKWPAVHTMSVEIHMLTNRDLIKRQVSIK